MAPALAPGDANAIRHVGMADFAGVAAVDMKDVERELRATVDEPRQDLARIAGEQVHPPRELAFQIVDAFGGVGVGHDVDAVRFELRARGQRKQRAVAGVDADFEQALLEPDRPPDVSAGRRELGRGSLARVALLEVAIEDVALERLAGLPDDVGDALEASPERLGEDLIERFASDRIAREYPLRAAVSPE